MNSSRCTSRQPSAAFTLLELILVLVLIAILTTLATPALSGFARRAALDDTAAGLLALTQQAQTRAVYEAIPHRVVFNLTQRTATIEQIGDDGYVRTVGSGAEPVTWNHTIRIETDIEKTGTDEFVIDFQTIGLITPGSVVIEQKDRYIAMTCRAATERYRLVTQEELRDADAKEVLNALRL